MSKKNKSGPSGLMPFLPGDRAIVPTAVERHGETAWAEFQAAQAQMDRDFTETRAQTQVPQTHASDSAYATTQPTGFYGPDQPDALNAPSAPVAAAPARVATLDEAMLIARRNNRVCPMPPHWQALYEMLPGKQTRGPSPQPAPPFQGASWFSAGAMTKRMVLREQLEWAQRHGVLTAVLNYMLSLHEEQWHHIGDD